MDGASIVIGVEVGQRADGAPLRVPLEQLSTLLGGLPGSGKSSTLRCIAAGASMRDDIALVVIDAKRVELPLWRPRAALVVTELADATEVLTALVALVDDRFAQLEAEQLVYWPRSPERPQIAVVVDELAELVDSGEGGDKDRERLLRRLLSKGRAAGLIVVAATQRPSHDVLSTSVRDLFALRVAHACATREASTMILGQHDAGGAETLPLGRGHEGLCYVLGEGEREPCLARVDWLDPARARSIAEQTADRRPELELPTSAPTSMTLPARSFSADHAPVEVQALAMLAAGPSTAPAVARALGLSEHQGRRLLEQLAADGRVEKLNGSQWAAA